MELRAVRVEVDLVEDLEPALFDHHELLFGATLVLDGARLVRAVVDSVRDAVTVAVRIGTAVVRRRSGLVRARVVDIENAVRVVVEVRAAIFVAEPVEVFWLIRARIQLIDDAVAIRIHYGCYFLLGHRVAEHADQAPIRIAVTGRHSASSGNTYGKALGMEVLEAAEELDR